ncbi:chemokine XC receptor 1 [Rhinatrema bivittatum]|uniref:chemokine XC receptor 1 n=1 Tax=Rhinatrema bivittatum TaxID=194408 RepID=UPI001127A28E|nr:chemokine XC receptor 1 [Rhinatrema bivittatum]
MPQAEQRPRIQAAGEMAGFTSTASPDYSSFEDYIDYSKPCDKKELFVFGALLSAILDSLLFFFSLVGNSLVLWILLKYESLSSITNIFILNLSITDLLFSCLLPFWAVYHSLGWIFGDVLCKVMSAVFSVGFYSSIIFLTLMTVHRYLVVVNPLSALKTRNRQYGVLASLSIWTISIVVTVPVLTSTKVQSEDNGNFYTCEYDGVTWEAVSTYQQNLLFLISFTVIVFCYSRILKTLCRSRSHRRHRTVKLIFVIVVVFFLSWAPYNTIIFLHSLYHDCEGSKLLDYARYICEKVAFSHCCLNPIFYAFVGIKFRQHLMHLLRCYKLCHYGEPSTRSRIPSHDYEDGSLY